MTDPQRFVYISGTEALSLTKTTSPARRIFRNYFGSSQSSEPGSIIPSVIAWPHATDTNGISFPGSGIVGVLCRFNYTISEATNYTTSGTLVAVPDTPDWTLYTPRWSRDHMQRPNAATTGAQSFGIMQSAPFRTDTATLTPHTCTELMPTRARTSTLDFFQTWEPYRIRTNSALTDYYWMPEAIGNFGGLPTHFGAGIWTGYKIAGCRYIRFNDAATYAGPITLSVRYNLNGTNAGTGDTLLWSTTVASAPFDTGFVMHDGGANNFYAPSNGTKIFMRFQTSVSSATNRVTLGPRLDIPFPFTATGVANLVAPGGTWIGAGIPGIA